MFAELLMSAGLAAAWQAPAPPPPEQFTANCQESAYATDHLVCADAELRGLDLELKALINTLPPMRMAGSPLMEGQSEWFKRRSLCAKQADHAGCARAAYRERIRVLASLSEAVDASAQATRCVGLPEKGYRAQYFSTRLVLYRLNGEPMASALPAKAGEAWTPFTTYTVTSNGFRLGGAGGLDARCTPGP